ncbi:MAG: MerR family transcriptional regulator, partial [Planctomycetota bacterium]|nr:MerR family transcriptional regulator [Planctomycetota bacterium]
MSVASGRARTFSVAELAEHCGLPQAVVERWLSLGLLRPMRGSIRRFDFPAVGRARTLSELRRAGWTAPRIKARWQEAQRVIPDPAEALAGLLAGVGSRRVTVRTPDGRLLETSGQQLFDFAEPAVDSESALPRLRTAQDWFAIGVEAEAAGRLKDAARAYEHALPD